MGSNVLTKSFAFGELSAGISAVDTTLVLASGQGARFDTVPGGDHFYIAIIDENETSLYDRAEICKVTARSSDTLTITRAQDGTSAKAFPITGGNPVNKVRIVAGWNYQQLMDLVTETLTANYQLSSEKGAVNGYAGLDGSGDVPDAQLPAGIQRTSEKDASNGYLGLDSSKRLNNWAAFLARRTATQSVPVGITKIKFNSEVFDINGDFFYDVNDSGGATESRFTAPIAGVYLFSIKLELNDLPAGVQVQVRLYKNGGQYMKNTLFSGGSYGQSVALTAIVEASASDYFEVYIYNSHTANIEVSGYSGSYSFFSGTRVM